MNLLQIQLLLYFLAALVVASAIGVASYVLLRLLCERPPHTWLFICAGITIVVGGALTTIPGALPFVGVLLVLWTLATFADRNVQPSQENWRETFIKIAVPSACATFLVCLFWIGVNGFGFGQFALTPESWWFAMGYTIGALFSPSVSAIFLWLWKTILLRPGIDRHLYQEEMLQ